MSWLMVEVLVGVIVLMVLIWALWRYREARPPERNDNGIRVGAPKVYDNRSLSLMLEQLEQQLKTVQSIDAASMRAAYGTQQGERRTDLTATTDVTTTGTTAAAAGDKAADKAGDKKQAETSSKDSPTAPSDASPFKWSARAGDLLDEQVSLSYEIFNLRLLLERALSDRLLQAGTRLQAVIGIPVSIDPPPFATGCAATVELKIKKAASLVALFPQQETFNTWGVDRRRARIGATGTAGLVSWSSRIEGAEQAASLRRQADVVAMEREAGKDELVVAWQFRPAPGAATVAAGLRQMLMVIALPEADGGAADRITVTASIRSSWQKWDGESDTAGAGPGWGVIFDGRPAYHDWGADLEFQVPTTASVENSLMPVVQSIEWTRIGSEKAAIIIKGQNFFTGTTVVLGDTVIGADNGLTIKSERSIQVIAPIAALLSDGVLNGRYGPSERLVKVPADLGPAMMIAEASFSPSPSGDSFDIRLLLVGRDQKPIKFDNFKKLPNPILSVNGRLVPAVLVCTPTKDDQVRASVRVTAEMLPRGSRVLLLRWPFYGGDWSLSYQTYDPTPRVQAFRFSSGETRTSILLTGKTFEDGVRVILDQSYSITENGSLMRLAADLLKLELTTSVLNAHRECFICERPPAATLVVPIPAAEAKTKPALEAATKPPVFTAGTGGTIDVTGRQLDAVTTVTMNDVKLGFASYGAGASLSILVPDSVVSNPGKYEISLATSLDTTLVLPVLVRTKALSG